MSPSPQTHRSSNHQKLHVSPTDEQAGSVIAQIAHPDEIAHLVQHVADAGSESFEWPRVCAPSNSA